jgi:small membrane protein
MLTPIQYLLAGLVLLLTVAAIRTFHNKLFYRLLVLGGLVTALVFILYPTLTAQLAALLNVGRGVDLVFYLLFLVLGFTLVVIYRRLLQLDETITIMNRRDAIRNARRPNA